MEARRWPPVPEPARWLIRFGYDGAGFQGWARQPGARTIEGVILDGLRRRGLLTASGPPLEVASRTDRGVSARGNALTLSSALPGPSLLRALNGLSPEIFFVAAARVPPAFRVRSARRRTYRYFEHAPEGTLSGWRDAAHLFRGPIDVRSFGREIPGERPSWREIESVTVRRQHDGFVIEVRAPSYVWGMVRKIVGVLREVAAGRLASSRLEAAIRGRERLTLPMAEATGLVLWEVEYPRRRWAFRWSGPNRYQAAWWARARRELAARGSVLDTLPVGPAGRRERVRRNRIA